MPGPHASLRAVLALLVSTLLAVGLFPGPAAARPPQRTLSVLSYNIHHGVGGDGRLDLDRIAAVIRDSGADVAALQEVDRHWSARSGLADQAKELARRLRMHHAYGANLDRAPAEPGQPRRQYGTRTPAAGRGDRRGDRLADGARRARRRPQRQAGRPGARRRARVLHRHLRGRRGRDGATFPAPHRPRID